MEVRRWSCLVPLAAMLLASFLCPAEAAVRDLKVGYHAETCPEAEDIVHETMQRAPARETGSVASVMHLQYFHDCFVYGCDGSVLTDAAPTMLGDKDALPNIDSPRSLEVVDEIKDEALEERCPGMDPCADIVAMGTRDPVVLVEGGAVGGKMNHGQKKWLPYWLLAVASVIILTNHIHAAPVLEQLFPLELSVLAVLLCAICLILRAVKQMM